MISNDVVLCRDARPRVSTYGANMIVLTTMINLFIQQEGENYVVNQP